VNDAAHDLCVGLKQQEYDLAMLFATHHYGPNFEGLVQSVYNALNCRNLIGCTGESIVGPTAEIESRPAVALWLAHLPGVRVVPFLLDQEDLEVLADAEPAAWHDRVGVTPADNPSFVILPDMFTIDVSTCLAGLDAMFPGATIVGGVASGASSAGKNRLFLGETCLRRGLVGVSLSGPVSISSVVSQGCRPVGEPYIVTKTRDNLIVELGGKPALGVLREVFNGATAADQLLMQNGLHVGRLIDEQRRDGKPGAFLIRNMIGITQSEALAIGDFLRPGQTVQFHVRDSRSADDEMARLLQEERERFATPPQGALLFTCNGRGQRFFRKPNHDIALVNTIVGDCPTAGFFASGEIGPVGGRTFIHGFTSSLILFRPVE
jgi:small ligand-binding sensory domain FIST